MGREAKLLVYAVQLLTRLPTPRSLDYEPDIIARSAKYFPLVGQFVGLLAAAVLILASRIWSGALPSLLAIGAAILITGAFHEDGLADTADGLGGGSSREQRLAIMKDSRIGTYGMIALVLCLALKVLALAGIPPAQAALVLIAAHGGARWATVTAMVMLPYGGDPASAKLTSATARVNGVELLIATAFALWPLALMNIRAALAATVLGVVAGAWPALKARRLIGGYTGDVLGAVEQLFEAGFLVGAAAILSAS